VFFGRDEKAVEGHRTPKRWRDTDDHRTARSVLECAGPPALSGAGENGLAAGRAELQWHQQ